MNVVILSSVDCRFLALVFYEVLIVKNLRPLVNFLLLYQQHGSKADDAWSASTVQSSKFAHWFLEDGMSCVKTFA